MKDRERNWKQLSRIQFGKRNRLTIQAASLYRAIKSRYAESMKSWISPNEGTRFGGFGFFRMVSVR